MKKNYTFVLNFGYVESARLGFVPFTSSKKFANAREALQDLAEFFKAKFIKQEVVDTKACCLKTKEKDSEAEYCTKCRKSLAAFEFDGEVLLSGLFKWAIVIKTTSQQISLNGMRKILGNQTDWKGLKTNVLFTKPNGFWELP